MRVGYPSRAYQASSCSEAFGSTNVFRRVADNKRTCRINKSWLACALAHKACRDGFFALHKRSAELFRELAVARADGSFGQFLLKLSRVDVLVLDDFAMAPLKEQERRDFLEICDDRYQRRSTILTSQLPVNRWHEQIGDPTIADSIMDRILHNAYRMDSMANPSASCAVGNRISSRRNEPSSRGTQARFRLVRRRP